MLRILTRFGFEEPLRDDLTRGVLSGTNADLPKYYVLALFPDASDLRNYVHDREHSRMRLNAILSMADYIPEVKSLLEKYRIVTVEDMVNLKADAPVVFEELEKACKICRIELRDDEMLEFFVRTEPPGF